MPEAWRTRSGEADNSQVGQKGDDMAALQNRRSADRRNRPMVEEAQNQADNKRIKKLKRRAQLNSLKESLTNPKIWIPLALLASLLVAWLLLGGWIKQQINPPLKIDQVEAQSGKLQVIAESRLGAPAKSRGVVETSAGFETTYRAAAGAQLFQGGKAARSCSITLLVDKQSPESNLKISVVKQKACSSG